MKNRIDILLIKPGSQKELYGKITESSLTAIEPPLWAGLITTYLRRRGYSVQILDAEAEMLGPSRVADRISEIHPLLAGIVVSGTTPSVSTMNMLETRAILVSFKYRQY